MVTRKEALNILKEEGIEGGVLRHSFKVNQVAVFLGKKIMAQGVKINLYLLDVASLLHDVGKILSDKTDKNHTDAGAEILKKRGLPGVAEIIRKHPINAVLEQETIPKTWEEKRLFYAN